jgi:hypothetical protein
MDMTTKAFSVVTNYSALNAATGKLNGANGHGAGSLNGIFTRRQDFESSTKQLMQQLGSERMLALRFADKGYGGDDFKSKAQESDVRLHMNSASSTGDSSFDTYDLSPALRHFVNDYCRILEPLLKLLAQKHTDIPAQNPRRPTELIPFNSYIKKLDNTRTRTPLDHNYFIKLYDELWNDYKHAESSGVQTSGWSSDGKTITSEPKLYSSKLVYFKDMLVKDFIEKSLKNMSALLDYVA